MKTQKKVEEQLLQLDQKCNNLDQYSRRSNLEIQGIPANVSDEKLEAKVIYIFSCLGIEVEGADIEDCHRLGYVYLKNTIVRFGNHKLCYQALDRKLEVYKLDSKKLGFNPVKILYFNEKLTPLNQLLAWKCRELKENP